MHQLQFSTERRSLLLETLRSAKGWMFDKDGLLLDSERFLQAENLGCARQYAGVEEFTPEQTAALRACLGKPDDEMSRLFWRTLNTLLPSAVVSALSEDEFVPHFVSLRADAWRRLSADGSLQPMPGALALLDWCRKQGVCTGLYTAMPSQMVQHTVSRVLGADDLFPARRRVTCDDPRLGGLGKPHPRGWLVLAEEAETEFGHAVSANVAFEDRATGTRGALEAGYRAVVVVPDVRSSPIEVWDKNGLIEEHFAAYPADEAKLFVISSLEELLPGL